MAITPHRVSMEEFLKLAKQNPDLELIGGVVSEKRGKYLDHSWLQAGLMTLLGTDPTTRRRFRVVPELRMAVGNDVVRPDIALYPIERIPRNERGDVQRTWPPPLPDLVIEIRSPDQTIRDQMDKCRLYAAAEIPLALLVVTEDRTVRVFRPGAAPITLRGDDRIDLAPVLPDFALTVADIFAALRLD